MYLIPWPPPRWGLGLWGSACARGVLDGSRKVGGKGL